MAASNRASGNRRPRVTRALDAAAWLQARLTGAIRLATTLSRWHDFICVASLVAKPLAPERIAALGGMRVINMPPLTAHLVHRLGRLGFLQM